MNRPLGDRDGLIEYLIPPALCRNKQNNLPAADSKNKTILRQPTVTKTAYTQIYFTARRAGELVLLRVLLRDDC